jgi:hypothetical protein
MDHSKAQGITIQVVHIFNQQRVVSFLALLAIQKKQKASGTKCYGVI